jgi:hypothetical protein
MVQRDSVRIIRVNHQRFIMMSGRRGMHPWHYWHDHDSERMPVGTGMAIIHCHSPLARRGRRRRPGWQWPEGPLRPGTRAAGDSD